MLDLTAAPAVTPPGAWDDAASWWGRLTDATAHLPAPVAALDLDALRFNALDLLVRASGVPVRVASKSIRVRGVLDAVLRLPGYRGVLAFTLPEALWLSQWHDDIVLGYPSVDRAALAALAADERAAARITLMVDAPEQLDAIEAAAPTGGGPDIRVAIDVDASWRSPALGHIGVRRSPLFTSEDVAVFAREIVRRPRLHLVGLMMYEAQIAGVGDKGDALVRWVQARSRDELRGRRAEIVAAVARIAPIEFVNGGGTGSLEYTASDEAITEVTAGSGLLAGHLFDGYRAFDLAPAAAFAFDVVRKPLPDVATVLGGGWVASGPPSASRLPVPVWPEGLRMLPREGAGEVQTPVRGAAALGLTVGDRVWFRHAKSGEASERVDAFHLVAGDAVIDELPTYRGEGRAYL